MKKDAHLNKKKEPMMKETQGVCGKPQRRDEKPQFEQECNVLALFRVYYV